MEEAIYTVVKEGKPTGPYRLTELPALALRPDTFIRKVGMDDYKEAHELPELRELLGFRHQQVAPQYFASFDQRLAASIVDFLIILAFYLVIMLMAYMFLERNIFRIIALIGALLVPLIKLVYCSIAEASVTQASIGKRLMDIKVTDINGHRLSTANSFGRNFGKIISNLSLCFGYLYMFLNKKQQCFHDIMAEALVVKERLI